MLWFRRIFFGIWCLLFFLFAYWQFNDPDPWLWVPIYLGAAVLCALAVKGRYPMPVLIIFIILCLVGAVYFYPSSVSEWVRQEWEQQDLSMKTQSMEEARESFGLLVVSIIMSVAAFFGWRTNKAGSSGTRTVSGRPARG